VFDKSGSGQTLAGRAGIAKQNLCALPPGEQSRRKFSGVAEDFYLKKSQM
jgi:hypothetical protein